MDGYVCKLCGQHWAGQAGQDRTVVIENWCPLCIPKVFTTILDDAPPRLRIRNIPIVRPVPRVNAYRNK